MHQTCCDSDYTAAEAPAPLDVMVLERAVAQVKVHGHIFHSLSPSLLLMLDCV